MVFSRKDEKCSRESRSLFEEGVIFSVNGSLVVADPSVAPTTIKSSFTPTPFPTYIFQTATPTLTPTATVVPSPTKAPEGVQDLIFGEMEIETPAPSGWGDLIARAGFSVTNPTDKWFATRVYAVGETAEGLTDTSSIKTIEVIVPPKATQWVVRRLEVKEGLKYKATLYHPNWGDENKEDNARNSGFLISEFEDPEGVSGLELEEVTRDKANCWSEDPFGCQETGIVAQNSTEKSYLVWTLRNHQIILESPLEFNPELQSWDFWTIAHTYVGTGTLNEYGFHEIPNNLQYSSISSLNRIDFALEVFPKNNVTCDALMATINENKDLELRMNTRVCSVVGGT